MQKLNGYVDADGTFVRKVVKNPKWKVVVTCQGQPSNYQYKNVFSACVGLIWHYFKKRKYGTMNFSIRQVMG